MVNYVCVGYGGKKKKLSKLEKPFNIKKEVSIILPTYNEEENIKKLIEQLRKEFKEINYEIVILDDNSKDNTPKIIDELAKNKDVLAIHRYGKKGYFSAYQDAIFMANGMYVLTMDSDLSHPPKTAHEFLKYKDKYDIVSGSRYMKGGGMKAPFSRKYGSLWLNKICALIIGLNLTDIAGDFHLIRKSKFLELEFKYLPVFGEFDFELLYRATKKGFSIKEIPFTYKFREEGESAMGSGANDAFKLMKFAWAYVKMALRLRFKG